MRVVLRSSPGSNERRPCDADRVYQHVGGPSSALHRHVHARGMGVELLLGNIHGHTLRSVAIQQATRTKCRMFSWELMFCDLNFRVIL